MADIRETIDGGDILDRDDPINFRDYERVIIKRRRIILAVWGLIVTVGLIICLTATPIYEATVGIIIDKEENEQGSLREAVLSDTTDAEYYQTMCKIFESKSVILNVIKRLGLDKNKIFFTNTDVTKVDNETLEENLIEAFQGNLKIVPVMKSHYVNIKYQSKDPALAAEIANAIVDAYREHAFAMKLDSVKNSVQWLNDNMALERKTVETAEQALLSFREKNNIVMDFSTDTETVTAQKLAQLNEQVAAAEAARTEVETSYKQAEAVAQQADNLDSIPEAIANPVIQQIKATEVELLQRRSELSKKYGPLHREMIIVQSELKTLQAKKEQEIQRIISSLYNAYQVALAKEKSLKDALAAQKKEVFTLNKNAIEYTGLYCEAEGAKAMYTLLLKRFKETSVTENLKVGNVRVVDKAKKPIRPIKPNKRLVMFIAFIIGLVMALGTAFLLEYIDDAINTPEDIKQLLRIPFLGTIPLRQQKKAAGMDDAATTAPELEAFFMPRSPLAEAYRNIRTNIFYSLPDTETQAILVTSAISQDGKTTSATNIAITMAQFGYRVALLDCDFHHPQIGKLFAIAQEYGMTNLLVGNKKIDEVVCATEVPNLLIIPSGPIPPNPSEILGSKKMLALMEELKLKYDKIIIDSPPIAAVTDALMAAHAVDGIVFVVRGGKTPRKNAENAVEALNRIEDKMLGVVLNGLDTHLDGYHYYSKYQSHYDDGDSTAQGKPQGWREKIPVIAWNKLKKLFLG